MIESVLTVFAVVLALTHPMPQIVRVLRRRTIAGVSGATTWLGVVVNCGWLAYGVAEELIPLLVLSSAYMVGYATIGVLLVWHGNRAGVLTAAAVGAGFVAIVVVFGWTALGTVLALAVAVQFLPQIIEAWRADDLSGLAPGTYLVSLLDGLVWGAYGLVVGDGPLVLYGVLMCAIVVLVLLPWWRWSRRVVVLG